MTSVAVGTLTGAHTAMAIERDSRRLHFAPPPRLTVSEWADRYRFLSSESSAEPGRWRTDWFPPLREIMDCISDPVVERVTVQKPAQMGWTEIIGNAAGFMIDLDPSPMLVVLPTLDDAKMWSKERFDPMLRDTPRISGKISYGNRREKDQSILRKTFPGGFIAIVGATSARGLRSRPVRWLIGDERDAMPISARGSAKQSAKDGATGEGDPWSLAIKRTTRFWNRKIIEGSTPTVKGISAIERARQQGSNAECYLPCPHCGHMQTLKWDNLRWESGQPETAIYTCGIITKDGELEAGCGKSIEHYQLPAMLRMHRWTHKYPERKKWRSFWINALYCIPWVDLATEWLAAQGNREELKVFVNTRLAETWDDSGEQVSESALEARRADYGTVNGEAVEVPMWAAIVTQATDVQADRLEIQVKAWGAGEESCLVHYEVLWGDPAQPEVWRQHDLILERSWLHASGVRLKVRCAVVDSGGHHTDQVYRYCKARRSKNVWPIKGNGEDGRAAVSPPPKKSKNRLWTLGSNALKDIVFARLAQETTGPGYMHFPKWVNAEYFGQLTSEKRITVYVNGRVTRRYVLKGGKRNEALDLECYALAALYILGPVRDRLHLEVKKLEPAPDPVVEEQEAAGTTEVESAPTRKPSYNPSKPRSGGYMNWRNR